MIIKTNKIETSIISRIKFIQNKYKKLSQEKNTEIIYTHIKNVHKRKPFLYNSDPSGRVRGLAPPPVFMQ